MEQKSYYPVIIEVTNNGARSQVGDLSIFCVYTAKIQNNIKYSDIYKGNVIKYSKIRTNKLYALRYRLSQYQGNNMP